MLPANLSGLKPKKTLFCFVFLPQNASQGLTKELCLWETLRDQSEWISSHLKFCCFLCQRERKLFQGQLNAWPESDTLHFPLQLIGHNYHMTPLRGRGRSRKYNSIMYPHGGETGDFWWTQQSLCERARNLAEWEPLKAYLFYSPWFPIPSHLCPGTSMQTTPQEINKIILPSWGINWCKQIPSEFLYFSYSLAI